MIKVSVIVPVYNTKEYLNKCLDSLINQTLQELEIIVVDDGSTDGSTEIIRKYEREYPNKVKVFYKQNGGQASARNLGLKKVSGEYIGFFDSDDFADLNMFESLYKKAKDEQADFVGCAYRDLMYRNGKKIIIHNYLGNKVCDIPRKMFFNAIVCPFTSFYRADVIRNSGAIFPEGVIFEDTAFWINQIPYIKKNVYIEQAFANRVLREGSTTALYSAERIRQIFPVLKCIITFYKTNNVYMEYQQEIEYFCMRILLCSSMQRISTLKTAVERKQMISETYEFIDKNFPDFSRNIYMQHSFKNFYIKNSTPTITRIVVKLLRLQQLLKNKQRG